MFNFLRSLFQRKPKRDAYDEAVDYFKDHPEEIYKAWNDPGNHSHGHLFAFMSSSRESRLDKGEKECGCPTMVMSGKYYAATPELTSLIRSHSLIPSDGSRIDASNLEAFAEVQREADRLLDRDPPRHGAY